MARKLLKFDRETAIKAGWSPERVDAFIKSRPDLEVSQPPPTATFGQQALNLLKNVSPTDIPIGQISKWGGASLAKNPLSASLIGTAGQGLEDLLLLGKGLSQSIKGEQQDPKAVALLEDINKGGMFGGLKRSGKAALSTGALNALFHPIRTLQQLGGGVRALGTSMAPTATISTEGAKSAGSSFAKNIGAESVYNKVAPSVEKAQLPLNDVFKKLSDWGKVTYNPESIVRNSPKAQILNQMYGPIRSQIGQVAPVANIGQNMLSTASKLSQYLPTVPQAAGGMLKATPGLITMYLLNRLVQGMGY